MFSLTSDNKELNRFLICLKRELKSKDTTLVLSLSEVYLDGVRVGGYYNELDKEIVIKFGDDWLELLLHEYSHFLQHTNNKKIWLDLDDSLFLMWQWLDKEIELDKKTITTAIRKVQRLELDCERNTIALIKKYKLPIDLEEYIRNANMYIYFHNYVLERRRWFKEDMGIESFKKLLPKMPKDLKGNRNKMPKEWYKIIDSYF